MPPSPRGTRAHDTDSSRRQARHGGGGAAGPGRGCTPRQAHTQSYLGAMNTCPSDSKLFGSRYSKSATERQRYPAGAANGGAGGRRRERDRQRERAGKETGCVGNKRERRGRRAGRPPPRWEDLDRIGWLAARARSARLGGTLGHACTRTHTYICTRSHVYICVVGGVSLLLGSSTTGGNRMLCSWAQENHRNTWSSERKGDFRHRHGQTGHLDEDSPTSGSSRGEGTRSAPRGPAAGPPSRPRGGGTPAGTQPPALGHPAPSPLGLSSSGARGCAVRGDVLRDIPGSPQCRPPTPAGTAAPQCIARPGGAAQPEVGLLLSEGCRQGLGTSR